MSISIIIHTFNGEDTLRELLAVLHFQTIPYGEILVADSSSSDRSAEVCRGHHAKVTIIPQTEFDHGGTRSMLAKMAKGDILVFFTQDAVPVTRDALEKLVSPLRTDPKIAASYGRQLPRKHAGFSESFLRKFNYPEESAVRSYADRGRLGIHTIFTSNSFAAYRRSSLKEVGWFRSGLIFGEDTCAVGRLLQRGWKIAYVGDAAVIHSHEYDLADEFRRSFDIGVLHESERELFNDFGKAESRGGQFVRTGLQILWQKKQIADMMDFLLRAAVKFVGYKAGRNFQKIPPAVVPSLSLNRGWWEKKNTSDQL